MSIGESHVDVDSIEEHNKWVCQIKTVIVKLRLISRNLKNGPIM